MKIVYLIRHSAPFVEIDNYADNDNVLWSEFNKNMILSSKGEENAKKLCDVEELKNIDKIYASNSFRAIGSAKYLAESNNLKIKLDDRINERKFGVKYIKDLPNNFTEISFDDKDFKINDGESLNDVNNRFNSFINDLLNDDVNKVAIVMHGITLLSYLKTICNYFNFDGRNFEIKYNNKIILNGTPKNPSIYKVVFNDDKKLINVEFVECVL